MKALFIGLGGAGQRLLRIFQQEMKEPVEWLAYRALSRPGVINPDFSLEKSKEAVSVYGLRSFSTLEEALDEKPDFAVIANPTSHHLNTALKAARVGCHLLIEKPLAAEWEGVEELVQTVRRNKLKAMVGYQTRFHPCLRWIREQLQENTLGAVSNVRIKTASYLPAWHPYEDFHQLYAARQELGGGVILTESHEIDYALWLFGRPLRVEAKGGNLGPFPMNVEDTAAVTMEFAEGPRRWPVHFELSFVENPAQRSFELTAEGGTITWDDKEWDTVKWNNGKEVKRFSFPGWDRQRLFVEEVRHFLRCLSGQALPCPNIEEAAEGLQILLACKRSLESGRSLDLEPVRIAS